MERSRRVSRSRATPSSRRFRFLSWGTPYSHTVQTADVDGDVLTIVAGTLPSWMTFVDNGDGTATLSGTPTAPGVTETTRAKCIPVGCCKVVPSEVMGLPVPVNGARVIGIFENLHWDRYDRSYAERFILDTQSLAFRHPEILFLVKPHHAGQWLTSRYRGGVPRAPNLIIADPAHPDWEQFTASQLINSLDGVITTPSTVALDAARAGKPVAVVGYGLDLSVYRPLPVLTGSEDWMAFLHNITDDGRKGVLLDQAYEFVARTIHPGVAAANIVHKIEDDLRVQSTGWGRTGERADPRASGQLQKVV